MPKAIGNRDVLDLTRRLDRRASSSACATISTHLTWIWIPLAAFALFNAGTALLRIVFRSEA